MRRGERLRGLTEMPESNPRGCLRSQYVPRLHTLHTRGEGMEPSAVPTTANTPSPHSLRAAAALAAMSALAAVAALAAMAVLAAVDRVFSKLLPSGSRRGNPSRAICFVVPV